MTQQQANLTLDQIAESILATPDFLRRMLQAVDERIPRWQPGPKEWCINEVIGHLILTDLEFMEKIDLILTEWRPQILGTDVNGDVAARRDDQKDIFDLLDEFETLRREVYAPFLRSLPTDQLGRVGIFEETDQYHGGEFQAADYVYEWPYHDYLHLNQIANNIRAYLWPAMSETMRQALSEDNPPI